MPTVIYGQVPEPHSGATKGKQSIFLLPFYEHCFLCNTDQTIANHNTTHS